jgi:hypothetical protein
VTGALLRLRRIRATRRSKTDPRLIALKRENVPVLQRLYPGLSLEEIKAQLPLKKIGSGCGTRYFLVPRQVDEWLDGLPSA